MDEEPEKHIPIRRIVRSKDTGLFLGREGQWVGKAEDAADWGSIAEVVELCVKFGVKNSELVLHFGSEQFNVVLEISTPG
jgi:hypothetical protein